MDTTVIGTLQELRCAALADYFLGHVAPNQPITQPLNLTTLEDLYAYLLLDSQVGQQPESSDLAEAIAAVQQYLNAIYHGMEPGHANDFSKAELDAWHIRDSNIGNWAGYKMLVEYPENYINPTLRLGKTESFDDLINDLAQGSIEEGLVQTALSVHLTKFERLCNLTMKAGHINSIYTTDPGKGKNFKNADYYFIGQERVPPYLFYWRKAEVELNASSTFLPPSAWSEWKEIKIPPVEKMLALRPVFFANRLMVVFVEGKEIEDQQHELNDLIITILGGWTYKIQVTYLDLSGNWSVPKVLAEGRFTYELGALTKLVVTTYVNDPDNPYLHVGFAASTKVEDGVLQGFYVATDKLFSAVDPDKHTLDILLSDFHSEPGALQYNFIHKALAPDTPRIREESSGAQFLDMRALEIEGVEQVRLNSLFGSQLVAKAAVSIDELLSLATQNTLEPQPEESEGPAMAPIDFNSAHGTFYWELFFHMVFLVACRLREEGKYLESQRWFHYLFNPHIRVPRPGEPDPSAQYWLCRPLLERGLPHFESKDLADPDGIAFADRIHYRKAVFVNYVRCILAHADSLYRQLTRDSLAAAKLQYMRALALMGPAPAAKSMDYWVPQSVNDILEIRGQGSSSLETFAAALKVDVWDLPARVNGTPDFSILELDVFRAFTNDELLNLWTYINECLFNMRHNLTIDGKQMSLALYEPPTNPNLLLLAQAGGSSGAMRNAGGWKTISHYRFRPLLGIAQNAVQMLIAFGREVRGLMEARDRTQLEELVQVHTLELSEFTIDVHKQAINQIQASLKGLEESRRVAEERAQYYQALDESRLVSQEIAADKLVMAGKVSMLAMNGVRLTSGLLDLAPNTFGFANGGMKFGAALQAASDILGFFSSVAFVNAEGVQKSAFYTRRSQEWQFAAKQARGEILAIDQQIVAMQHSLTGATASLEQTRRSHAQADAILSFYKTRSTSIELYRWMLGQMSTLYFQAYDTVLSLCLMAQSSLQYEMGDFSLNLIRTGAWIDKYHGFTSGEALQGDVARMERVYLERNERRLELTKTISVRQLFERGVFGPQTPWEDVIATLLSGKIDFELPQRLFDENYPGHYCRQVVMVSLSVPVSIGSYKDLCVTLTQLGSTTALQANIDSLAYLYGEGEGIPPDDVVLNLRNNQQIAISNGVDDSGMHQMALGDDGRYVPFEGTGAVSRWRLAFPRPTSAEQKERIESLTDLILHLRYSAKVGGPAYTAAVQEKLDS